MYKIVFLSIILLTYSFSDTKKIDKKIEKNKYILQKNKKAEKLQDKKVKQLAEAIENEEKINNDLERKLSVVSNNIFLNKIKLQKAKKDIITLNEQTQEIQSHTQNIEEAIVNSVVDNYSLTLSQDQIGKKSIDAIIQKEKFQLLFDDTKEKILNSNLEYFKLSNAKQRNIEKKEKLEAYIVAQEKEKVKFKKLQENQKSSIETLKNKHKAYQKELKSIIDQQYNINELLGKLNILKKNELKKERLAKLKAKQLRQKKEKERKRKERLKKLAELKKKQKKEKQISIKKKKEKVIKSKDIKMASKTTFKEDIDLKVRNIGDSTKGIKISNYKGVRISAPLKSYTITKKFGKYFDPVYKIQLFNESISLKSKKQNVKVYSVLKGKVVYAKKDAGALGNVVILKHSGNLHTIYSQLSKIPSTIRVNKWVPKGYVIGRVKDTLVFQVTKNSKYLDPEKLIRK
jgi:murein DD-endopeptidase MepM/ murein hydrolase activator NlpD